MACFIMVACHTLILASLVIAVDASHRRRQKQRKQEWYCRMMDRSEN